MRCRYFLMDGNPIYKLQATHIKFFHYQHFIGFWIYKGSEVHLVNLVFYRLIYVFKSPNSYSILDRGFQQL